MKEVQGASIVENTSIKSARTILSTVLNDYTDYQDHILSNEASKKISEQISLKSELPASCTQKTVKRRTPAVNNPERVGCKNSDGDENEDNMCPPPCKLSQYRIYNFFKKVENLLHNFLLFWKKNSFTIPFFSKKSFFLQKVSIFHFSICQFLKFFNVKFWIDSLFLKENLFY